MKCPIEIMKSVNSIQLDILKEFIRICDLLNLKYYAIHGTLLGAVRDGGFAYGDDDIDVAMPRPDYDIFISRGNKIISNEYRIQSNESEEEYPLAMAKVRAINTVYLQSNMKHLNITHGVYIDVFPLDDCASILALEKANNFMRKLCEARINSTFRSNKVIKTRTKAIRGFTKMLWPDMRDAISFREQLNRKQYSGDYVGIFSGKTAEKHIPRSWFDGYKTQHFEDIMIRIPLMEKEYLTKIYGKDYLNHNVTKAINEEGKQYIEIEAEYINLTSNEKDSSDRYERLCNQNVK